jgi:hypothetical protein
MNNPFPHLFRTALHKPIVFVGIRYKPQGTRQAKRVRYIQEAKKLNYLFASTADRTKVNRIPNNKHSVFFVEFRMGHACQLLDNIGTSTTSTIRAQIQEYCTVLYLVSGCLQLDFSVLATSTMYIPLLALDIKQSSCNTLQDSPTLSVRSVLYGLSPLSPPPKARIPSSCYPQLPY